MLVETETGFFGSDNGNHFLNCCDKKGREEGDSGLKRGERDRLGALGIAQEGKKEVLAVDRCGEERLVISSNKRSHRKQGKHGFRGIQPKGCRYDRGAEANGLGERCQRGEQVGKDDLKALPLHRTEPLSIVKEAKDEEETLVA